MLTLASLEPPYDDIRIHADTDIELSHRVTAVSKERETCEFIESLPWASTFFDIGANVGPYSLIAARRGLHVYAFEPMPANYARLVGNAQLNELVVDAYPYVIGDKTGWCGLELSSTAAGSALHTVVEGDTIQCATLDDLVATMGFPVPDAVKVDVDGGEGAVVRGGMDVWPLVSAVQVEIDDSLDYREIIDRLTSCGLRQDTWTRHGSTSISNVLFRRGA